MEIKKGSNQSETESLDKTMELLILAYVAANMNFKDIPLKQFLDDCEKKILRSSLHLTRGSQKNTAVLLGLKPTALFEKIRKHGIDIRQIKQSGKLGAAPEENS